MVSLRVLVLVVAITISVASACKTFKSVRVTGDMFKQEGEATIARPHFMTLGDDCVYHTVVSGIAPNATYKWGVIVDNNVTVGCKGVDTDACSLTAGDIGEVHLMFNPTNLLLGAQTSPPDFKSKRAITNLWHYNNCPYAVDVIQTGNGAAPFQSCWLNPGGTCSSNPPAGWGGNYKNGWAGLALAEFQFDSWGLDWYDISQIVGCDTPLQIQAPWTAAWLTCHGCGCSDAYQLSGDRQTHSATTGGWFGIVWCPS